MARNLSESETEACSALYQKGMRLIEGRIALEGEAPLGAPGWFARWQLRRAIECFQRVARTDPEGWTSMLWLGKIHQRLGSHAEAMEWLSRAHALMPDETPLAKELAKEALTLGRFPEAVAACEAAVRVKPEDPELLSNLALAYCFVGNDAQAEHCARKAVVNAPEDRISVRVLDLVRAVSSGGRPRPGNLDDLQPRR